MASPKWLAIDLFPIGKFSEVVWHRPPLSLRRESTLVHDLVRPLQGSTLYQSM